MHAASRPHHLSQPFPIRWAWSTKFPPAQLGNFMLGVAAGALALRASAIAPTPGEVAPLQAAAKNGAASDVVVTRWRGNAWAGLVADITALSVVCLVTLLPLRGGTHIEGWDPLLEHALSPLLALWCAMPSAAPPFALRPDPATFDHTSRATGCSPRQSGARPRLAESRACWGNLLWPVRVSIPSTCTCCTRLSS